MTRAVTLEEILERRDQRAARQLRWISDCNVPLICLTPVTPGPWKDTPTARLLLDEALELLREAIADRGWALRREERLDGPAGAEALLAIDADALSLKRLTVGIEQDHPLGRLWDIDVLATTGVPLSREGLGLGPRRCLVCEGGAHACGRSRAHSLEELTRAIDDKVEGFIAARVGAWAEGAMLQEAELTPKPGLVDARNRGAHVDMDLGTLRASIASIGPWLPRFFLEGHRSRELDDHQFLARLRKVGLGCEEAMFAATRGVNTHKGSIFALGLLCGCAGRLFEDARLPDGERLCAEAARVATPLVDRELRGLQEKERGEPRTAGERLFLRHGLTGARGEAASGFATVRSHALPAYRRLLAETGDERLALLEALLELLAHNQDTNLAADGGIEAIGWVQGQARGLLLGGGAQAPGFEVQLEALDDALIRANLSPGGSADLLAVCRWLARFR